MIDHSFLIKRLSNKNNKPIYKGWFCYRLYRIATHK